MRKLILRNFQSPGDVLMLTAAVRDLHLTYPGEFQTDVRTPCPALWENNPYLTKLEDTDEQVVKIDCVYPLIHRSNSSPYHFVHGFRLFLNEVLKLDIQPHKFGGDIHLRDEEKHWLSQVDEITGSSNTRFWIIVSGGKTDYTTKWWDPRRSQKVVDHFRGRIQFAQCGDSGKNHVHPPLRDVIDLVGRTDLRQAVRLIYHAEGIVWERRAVDEWIDSRAKFHLMRDHPHHSVRDDQMIMACAFGGLQDSVPTMSRLVEDWEKSGRPMTAYCDDQRFLSAVVWPIVKDMALIHDGSATDRGANVYPFPTEMVNGRFVGERIYEDEHPHHPDREALFNDQARHAAAAAPRPEAVATDPK